MLELGSVDVVGKPVDLDRLALVVRVALALA
jgi:DNA-binding response OmpR family regulator